MRERSPAVPTAAERARTTAERGGPAALLPGGPAPGGDAAPSAAPSAVLVEPSGDALLVVPRAPAAPQAPTAPPTPHAPAVLELTDRAPVDLRQPVRGLLWITGWLRPLDPAAERAAVLHWVDRRPEPALLDVGTTARVLALRAASLVLADAEGTEAVPPAAFAAAEPDPFREVEAAWLAHLECGHADVLGQLARHVPARLRRPGARVRPLGVDRAGLRLRVEGPDGDADVRLPFTRAASDLRGLGQEVRRLLGCPFLRARGP